MNEAVGIKGTVTVQVKRADGNVEIVSKDVPNLVTTAGRDWIHGQVYNSGTTDEALYIALTVNSDVPAAGDTQLTGEISTGGLERAAGSVTHTAGTNTTSIAKTFTASGTHTAVQKSGLFTASTSGTMVHENSFSSVNLTNGDQLTITWTITAG
jgi:uncharacterized membrane protein